MLRWQRVGIDLINLVGMAGPSKKPLVAVVLAVLVLHAWLLNWWLTQQATQDVSAYPAAPAFRVRATLLKAEPQPPVPPSQSEVIAVTDEPGPRTPLATPAQALPEVAPPPSDRLVAVAASSQAPVASEPVWRPIPSHYFSDEQVDTLPIPKEDWLLDWQAAPTGAMGWVMTVRLWVSALGDIDHVEVLDAKPAGDWNARMVIPFARTPMFPATLAGQAVPVTYVVSLAPDMAQ